MRGQTDQTERAEQREALAAFARDLAGERHHLLDADLARTPQLVFQQLYNWLQWQPGIEQRFAHQPVGDPGREALGRRLEAGRPHISAAARTTDVLRTGSGAARFTETTSVREVGPTGEE